MKKFLHLILASALMIAFSFSSQQLMAQKAEKTKVKKELAKILKELPEDVQLQVLRYAEKRRDALKTAQLKQEKAKEQALATPQPAKAKPVQKEQAIKLNPSNNSNIQVNPPAKPIQPKRPSYIEKAASMAQTSVQWMEEKWNFGQVNEGKVVKHTYKFKNTGEQPLVLTRVKASCGCTTPKWSKEPIAPGEEGFIDVSFNTRGKGGMQTKSITINGNFGKNTKVLRLSGEVKRAAPSGE